MNKTDSILNTETRPNRQTSTGVGDKELFLHKDQMQWTAVYMQGKFFMADPHSISKLVQIQAQIELEKRLAQDDELQQRIRGQSFHSYRHKIDEAEQSCVTEVDPKRQKLHQFKIDEELQKQEELYLKRIAEARNKKKQEKKASKNLIHFTLKEKEDFKSVKMEKLQEEDVGQDLQHSMAIKITPSKQNHKNQSNRKDKKERSSEKHGLINANMLKSSTKKEKVEEILLQSKKIQQTPASRKQRQRKAIQMNSIVQIHIDPIKVASPKSIKSKENNSMMESEVAIINTKPQVNHHEKSPSILSLDSRSQHRITQQMVYERAGDRFFYQLHSKIDQLQQNIEVNKHQSPSPNKDKSPLPMTKTLKIQQRVPYKFQQSTVMINTKALLKDLNKQLKQIGMIQPAEDSRITQERHMSNISGIKLVEVEQENKQKNNEILDALNHVEKPTRINKDLEVVNEVTIKIEPTAIKNQNISQAILAKDKDENVTLQNKSDHCKLISSLINQQILQVAPKAEVDKNKQQKQKLSEQINLLKQVISELRVQRVKYQTSINDRNADDCGTIYSNFQKTERQPFSNKEQLSHRVSPSIINNFAESAVSQFQTNHYKSMATAKNTSGKIIKNYSPIRKMPKIQEERKSEIRQKQIRQEEYNETEHRETENNQNYSQQKSRQSQLMNIKDANSVKIPTGSQEVSHNFQENNTTKNLEIVNVNNSESVWAASHIKSKLLFNKSIAPTVNNSIKFQTDMQSSMPRPLNKHNHSQPPKFIIHEHDNHQKRHQSNSKRKVVNDFQQLQHQIKSNNKTATITQPAVDPKKRASKQGKYKTVQAKTASYHPDLNKIVFNNAETNLKAKIIEIEQSQKQKGFQSGISDRKNTFHESKSSKGFRLRRGSDSSRHSRVSSEKKSQKKKHEKPKQNIKQDRSNVYVPALHEQNYIQPINTTKQKQITVIEQVQNINQNPNFKVQKRKISFTQIQIPKIPIPPSPNIKIEEMAELIKSMSHILSLELRQGQLNRLIMKKYKNCIMLDLPNSQASKLVWHYNGKFYVGEWNEAEMIKSGEGIEYIPQKYYYNGQFLNGKRNGSGIMIQQSGNIYEGQWADGEKSGRGKYYDSSIKLNYEGQWKNSKRQGFGYFSIQNQSTYEGTFVQNLKDGFGTQFFYNQDSYKGQYSKGRFHGKGKYVWASGDSYQGQFYEGCKHGNGIWTSFIGEVYEGGYKNDKKTGSGKYKWGNGCVFQGQFEGDRKNGHGVLKYPDGREVKGIWKDGKLIQTFGQPREDDKQEPLSPKKSRVVQIKTHIKVENKPAYFTLVQQRKK